jgi:hypothetical protein
MKPRPAEQKAEVLLTLPRRPADIGTDDDNDNKDHDNSYGYFSTNKYKMKHRGEILCHNLRSCHKIHTKGLENTEETLSIDNHVKIKLMYVANEG